MESAADANGNYYLASGNGSYSGSTSDNYGDSILRLGSASSGTLPVLDSFTPWNQNSLEWRGLRRWLRRSPAVARPPRRSAASAPACANGKRGTIYLVDRAAMGDIPLPASTPDTQIVQEINNASIGVWGSPAYWNGNVYWSRATPTALHELSPSNLLAFSFNADNSGLPSTGPTSQSNNTL